MGRFPFVKNLEYGNNIAKNFDNDTINCLLLFTSGYAGQVAPEKWDSYILHLLNSGSKHNNKHISASNELDRYYNWYIGYTKGLWSYFYSYKDLPFPEELLQKINDAKEFWNTHSCLMQSEINKAIIASKKYSDLFDSNKILKN